MNVIHRGMALFWPALTLAYMAVIYWLSSLPGDDPGRDGLAGMIAWTPPALQNLLHIPLFGLLAWLWQSTLNTWSMRHGPALGIAFLMTAGFGAFDEWHQLHVPGRYASFTDIALNCAGAMLALWWTHRGKRRQDQPDFGSGPSG